MRTRRLLLVASAGGHWAELTRIARAFDGYDIFYATTARKVMPPTGVRPVAIITDASRWQPGSLVIMFFQVFWLTWRLSPDYIVTTGAAPGLAAVQIGRLFGARTVWIDSLANAEEMSMSGKLARFSADLWLTQWPHLAKAHSGLKYFGSVF